MTRNTDPTEYHEFDRPGIRSDWAESWDDVVESLDTNLKLRGALEERPATAPDGVEFEVVDQGSEHHGKVYQYDDSSGEWALADRQFKSVSTDKINTTPTGARVNISGSQTIAHDTLTTIDWGEESVRGDIGPVLNDGAIIIPDGFNWAKFTFFFHVGTSTDEMDLELAQIIRGGGSFDGVAGHRTSASPTIRELVVGPTAWTPVNSGDEFRARVRHQSGDSRDLSDSAWMEVSLL